jgi:DNA-binding CsgD family transcriptional regulator
MMRWPVAPLTPAEQVTLELMAEGLTEVEIARARHVTRATAERTRFNVRMKLGARNSPHAVALGFRLGLLTARASAHAVSIGFRLGVMSAEYEHEPSDR